MDVRKQVTLPIFALETSKEWMLTEQEAMRVKEEFEAKIMNSGNYHLVVLPPGGALKCVSPYYVRRKYEDHEEEIGFANYSEMMEYLEKENK